MITSFNRENEWPFERLTHRKSRADRKRQERNAEIYGRWVWSLLKETSPREPKENEQYTSTRVGIHPDHVAYLREHLDPWTWLNYSPRDAAHLNLDQVEITEWFTHKIGQ